MTSPNLPWKNLLKTLHTYKIKLTPFIDNFNQSRIPKALSEI